MLYIKFRKKFILPIRYFFQERRHIRSLAIREKESIIERLDELKAKLLLEMKRENQLDIQKLKGRVEELEWVIYAKTNKEKSST